MTKNRMETLLSLSLCAVLSMNGHAASKNLAVSVSIGLKEAFLEGGTTFELDHLSLDAFRTKHHGPFGMLCRWHDVLRNHAILRFM